VIALAPTQRSEVCGAERGRHAELGHQQRHGVGHVVAQRRHVSRIGVGATVPLLVLQRLLVALEVGVVGIGVEAGEGPPGPRLGGQDVHRVDPDQVLRLERLFRVGQRIGRRPVHEGHRRRAAALGLVAGQLVHVGRDPPLGRGRVRGRGEVVPPRVRRLGVDPVGAQRGLGVPLDADDPGGQPRRHVAGPAPTRPTGCLDPFEVTVDAGGDVGELLAEGVVDRRVVETPALVDVGLVGEIGPLDEVDRVVGMLLVVGGELVVEGGWVQGVDPDHADAEVGHLVQPHGVLLGRDLPDLAGLSQRHGGAEVDPGQEGLVARGRVEPEPVGVGFGEDAHPLDPGGVGGPARPLPVVARATGHEQRGEQRAYHQGGAALGGRLHSPEDRSAGSISRPIARGVLSVSPTDPGLRVHPAAMRGIAVMVVPVVLGGLTAG